MALLTWMGTKKRGNTLKMQNVGKKMFRLLLILLNFARNEKIVPVPGVEPGPLKDVVLSHACLPISSHRQGLESTAA